jgi:hypothetical protein
MAKTASKAPETAVVDDWNRRVNFDFGKGGLKEPKGFKELTVDEEVSVVVTGKVTSIRVDSDSSIFGLRLDSIKLKIIEKDDLASDFEGAKQGRKL